MRVFALNYARPLQRVGFGTVNSPKMSDIFKVGDPFEREFTVTPANNAVYEDGRTVLYPVLGTPSLLRFMELTTIIPTRSRMPQGRCLAGKKIENLTHDAPSYNNDKITIKNTVKAVDDNENTVTFDSVANSNGKAVPIGTGTITMCLGSTKIFERKGGKVNLTHDC